MKTISLTTLLATALLSAMAQTPKKNTAKPAANTPAPAASIKAGELVYKQYCLQCHMADGAGIPNMNPPLVKTSYVKGDKIKLIKAVLLGFSQPVDIDGQSYSNNMAPHGFLKDQEIADVLTYVRNSFGNKYPAIKPTDVKLARTAK